MSRVDDLIKEIEEIPLEDLALDSKFIMIAHNEKLTIGEYGSKIGLANSIAEMMEKDKAFKGVILKCIEADLKNDFDIENLISDE